MRSERGGAATLHAPGQLVSYPIVPVPGRDLRRFVWNLEEVLVRLLSDLGIVAERSSGRPGLYVGAQQDRFGRAALPAVGGQPRDVAQRIQ